MHCALDGIWASIDGFGEFLRGGFVVLVQLAVGFAPRVGVGVFAAQPEVFADEGVAVERVRVVVVLWRKQAPLAEVV